MKDLIQVETSDHAKLNLKLNYRWTFQVDKSDPEQCKKHFSVKDFIGDACKRIGSRIRGAVSGVTFDRFHTEAPRIIQDAVFKRDEQGNYLPFVIPSNLLCITQVDIESSDAVDVETQICLANSIKQSMNIKAESDQALAKHQALRQQQESFGMLELISLDQRIEQEKAEKSVYIRQAENSGTLSTGLAVANASAKAEADLIKAKAEVEQATYYVDSQKIKDDTELSIIQMKYDEEIKMKTAHLDLEISSKKKLIEIEIGQFQKTVEAIGAETIVEMAKAGPETQAKLLKGLGLEGYMIVDGKHTLNLMGTAQGMIATTK